MADLKQCDRCKKTTNGRLAEGWKTFCYWDGIRTEYDDPMGEVTFKIELCEYCARDVITEINREPKEMQ